MNGHAYIGNALRQVKGPSWFELRLTADQLAFIRVRGTHTKVGENCLHCESRHVSAETGIVSLVSSFVIVLTLSESFAGSGFRNPGRWTV